VIALDKVICAVGPLITVSFLVMNQQRKSPPSLPHTLKLATQFVAALNKVIWAVNPLITVFLPIGIQTRLETAKAQPASLPFRATHKGNMLFQAPSFLSPVDHPRSKL
jgi:hypothetical protein